VGQPRTPKKNGKSERKKTHKNKEILETSKKGNGLERGQKRAGMIVSNALAAA